MSGIPSNPIRGSTGSHPVQRNEQAPATQQVPATERQRTTGSSPRSAFDTQPAATPPPVAAPGLSGNLSLGDGPSPAAIFRSVQSGDVGALHAFLRAGGDPNTRDPASGMTLLLGAAVRGQAGAVRELLANRPPADLTLRHPGSQALPQHFAAQSGNAEVMRLLRDAGADMNAVWPVNGHTPLAEVAFNLFLRPGGSSADRQGLLDTMRLLVESTPRPDLAATSVMGRGILAGSTSPPGAPFIGPTHPARAEVEAILYPGGVPPLAELQAGNQAYLGNLLSGLTPPLPTEPVARARQELANQLNGAVQAFMNQAAIQPPTADSSAALEAARARVQDLVQKQGAAAVLNLRAGPLEQTALHVAARPNPGNPAQAAVALPMVKFLLEQGARVTTEDGQPLVERSPMGVTAPFRPAVFGYAPILEAILQNEVDRGASPAAMNALVNQPGPANGMTMVLDAIGGGHRDAVAVLLRFGARVTDDLANYQGQTAFTLARQRAGSATATQADRELLQLVEQAAGAAPVSGPGAAEVAAARSAVEGWFKQLDTIDVAGRGDNLLKNLDLESGNLHLQYPGGAALIEGSGQRGVETFKQWYGPVVDNFASNHHTLRSLDVKPDGNGGFDFRLVVNWQADPKAAAEPDVNIHVAQEGKLVRAGDGRFLLQRLEAAVLPA